MKKVALVIIILSSTLTLKAQNVSKVGTPADNQVAVWTGNGTLEGDGALTWNGTRLKLEGEGREITVNAPGGYELKLYSEGIRLDDGSGVQYTYYKQNGITYRDDYITGGVKNISAGFSSNGTFNIMYPDKS